MELFGIGIWELLLVVLIALIILGPQDMIKLGRNLGRAVRRFFSSEEWRTMLQASKEIRTIPEKLLEETGLDHPEEILPSEAEIRQEAGLDDLERNMAEWKADLSTLRKGGEPDANVILPPQANSQTPTPAGARTASLAGTGTPSTGLEDLERDMAEWKADLSAWGSSKVIIPIPQATPAKETAEAQDQSEPAAQGQDDTASISPAAADSAAEGQEDPAPTTTQTPQQEQK
jgi:Sec-independent protein translocase protein TatA